MDFIIFSLVIKKKSSFSSTQLGRSLSSKANEVNTSGTKLPSGNPSHWYKFCTLSFIRPLNIDDLLTAVLLGRIFSGDFSSFSHFPHQEPLQCPVNLLYIFPDLQATSLTSSLFLVISCFPLSWQSNMGHFICALDFLRGPDFILFPCLAAFDIQGVEG